MVAFTSRNIRHRNNRLFGDDRILGYLAGVPKLVYGENPLVILPYFTKGFPQKSQHTPTSGLRLGTPKLNFHQIDGCFCPVCPWRWPVCNMSFLRRQKGDLITKKLFFRRLNPEQGGCLGSHSLNVKHRSAQWQFTVCDSQILTLDKLSVVQS